MKIIEHAIALLLEGELVAIPTETVYGLGADAKNPDALQKVFTVKGRPSTNPLIIHLPNWDAMSDWAIDIPPEAFQLAKAFWPGPLTLILKRHPSVPKIATGGQETVALRVPNHPLTLELLAHFKGGKGGIAAPSANRYGRISPTTAEHVREELGNKISFILDGGPCQVGIESTIVYLAGKEPFILRQGSITERQILTVLKNSDSASSLNSNLISNISSNNTSNLDTPLSISQTSFTHLITPGSSLSHYAPNHPLYCLKKESLINVLAQALEKHKKVAVLSFDEYVNESFIEKYSSALLDNLNNQLHNILWPENATLAAQQLYHLLRTLDKLSVDFILVEEPPENEEWLAIKDRLLRASSPLPAVF